MKIEDLVLNKEYLCTSAAGTTQVLVFKGIHQYEWLKCRAKFKTIDGLTTNIFNDEHVEEMISEIKTAGDKMNIKDLVLDKEYLCDWGDGTTQGLVFKEMHTYDGQDEAEFAITDGYDRYIFNDTQVVRLISEINPLGVDSDHVTVYAKALKKGQLIMITELQNTLLKMPKQSQYLTEEAAALLTMKCVNAILVSSRERLEGEL